MPSYFTLNSNTGQISVRASLTAEIRDSYQGRIVAFDGGSPPRSATAIATINIQRNLNSPVFSPVNYEQTILETMQVGTNILRVTASDADRSVSIQRERKPLDLWTCILTIIYDISLAEFYEPTIHNHVIQSRPVVNFTLFYSPLTMWFDTHCPTSTLWPPPTSLWIV